jgi:hypothetical protein
MSITETPASTLSAEQLNRLFQYTVEAYKTFEKLGENLPNPMAATMFQEFAVDEREMRELIEIKMASAGAPKTKVTLANDLAFQDILEGDLSFRETAEFLIAREKTMEKRLRELTALAPLADRNFLIYIGATKRAHLVELERELELIRIDPDWFRREDAEWRIVHGPREA